MAGMANLFITNIIVPPKCTISSGKKMNNYKWEYSWKKKRQQWNSMWIKASTVLQDIAPGSAEEFIFDHYYGYNTLNSKTAIEYSLEHPRWQVYPVKDYKLNCDVEKIYGAAFVPFIENVQPVSVFLARGSDVKVNMPLKIKKNCFIKLTIANLK